MPARIADEGKNTMLFSVSMPPMNRPRSRPGPRRVDDGKGGKKRALIIASGGGGDRVTAIDDPVDVAYVADPNTGATIPNDDWPNATTGVKGQSVWRQLWYRLHEAGFDILALDRRGVGISGGYSDTNTLQ